MNSHISIFNKSELPKEISNRLKGNKIEVIETEEGLLLKSIDNPVKSFRGILKGSSFSSNQYLNQKHADLELE